MCLPGSHFSPVEEEINNMKIELEKYGIQMPAFSKIGGILANELSVDEAARKRNGAQMGLLPPLSVMDTLMMVLDVRSFASKLRSADLGGFLLFVFCF